MKVWPDDGGYLLNLSTQGMFYMHLWCRFLMKFLTFGIPAVFGLSNSSVCLLVFKLSKNKIITSLHGDSWKLTFFCWEVFTLYVIYLLLLRKLFLLLRNMSTFFNLQIHYYADWKELSIKAPPNHLQCIAKSWLDIHPSYILITCRHSDIYSCSLA